MEPCRFFSSGYCARGAQCPFHHAVLSPETSSVLTFDSQSASSRKNSVNTVDSRSTTTTLRGEASAFVPSTPQCYFYLEGKCRRGSSCQFGHHRGLTSRRSTDSSNPSETARQIIRRMSRIQLDPSFEYRYIDGALISFDKGAAVYHVDVGSPGRPQSLSNRVSKQSAPRSQPSTVTCSWYKPSKIAWLHYHKDRWAQYAADRYLGKTIKGRKVQVKVVDPPPRRGRRRPMWSVEISNLDVQTTTEDLTQELNGIPPDEVHLGQPSSILSEREGCEAVWSDLVKSGGPLQDFEILNDPNSSRIKAIARFESPIQARAMVAQSRKRILHLGSPLYISHVASVKIPVLPDLYFVVKSSIEPLLQNHEDNVGMSVFHPAALGMSIIIRIFAEDGVIVAKRRIAVEQILAGQVIMDEEAQVLWDDFFGTREGLIYLQGFNQPGVLFVYRDWRRRQIRIHGTPELCEATQQAILERVSGFSTLRHVIDLRADAFQNAVQRGNLRVLFNTFGKQSLDHNVVKQLVIIHGSPDDADRAREILAGQPPVGEEEPPKITHECPVCTSECETRVELECGHAYCRECLERRCQAAEGESFPISCEGDSGNCKQVIKLDELKGTLEYDLFNDLLRRSFNSYIRSHPAQYQYCPTTHCPSTYRVTVDGTTVSCRLCLSKICTTCQNLSHDRLTCKESDSVRRNSIAVPKPDNEITVSEIPPTQYDDEPKSMVEEIEVVPQEKRTYDDTNNKNPEVALKNVETGS